jgi:BASS family bile acid:Na+ symporter
MHDILSLIQKLSVFVFIAGGMAAMGLVLSPRDILAPLRNVRVVLLALALNFLFAPAFAWALTLLVPLARPYATGLLLLGSAAGAPFLPKLAGTARCGAELALALMVLLTAVTIVFMPVALPLMVPGLKADAWGIARPLLLLIVAPLAGGMLVKRLLAPLAARLAPMVSAVSNASALLLVVLVVALNFRALLGLFGTFALLTCAVYFAGTFAAGWLLGGPGPETRGVMGLAAAARNFGAALVPAAGSFPDPGVMLMVTSGAIVCVAVTFPLAAWVRARIPRAA